MTLERTPERRAWLDARRRCHDPRAAAYANYGGRGIRMCEEWRFSFEAFLAHVGRRPGPGHSLDRIDNDRGYEPGNCRWATPTEQGRNTRISTSPDDVRRVEILLAIDFFSMRQIAFLTGLSYSRVEKIKGRLDEGTGPVTATVGRERPPP